MKSIKYIILISCLASCGNLLKYEANNPPANDYRICYLSYSEMKLTNNVDTLAKVIDVIISNDSNNIIPKGHELAMSQAVFDPVYTKFIYFNKQPREVYRIDLLTELSIASVLNIDTPKSTFMVRNELSEIEIKRISERFKMEYLPLIQKEYNKIKKN